MFNAQEVGDVSVKSKINKSTEKDNFQSIVDCKKTDIHTVLRTSPRGKIRKYIAFLDQLKLQLSDIFEARGVDNKVALLHAALRKNIKHFGKWKILGGWFNWKDLSFSPTFKNYAISSYFYDDYSVKTFIDDWLSYKYPFIGLNFDKNVSIVFPKEYLFSDEPSSLQEVFSHDNTCIRWIKLAIDTSYYGVYSQKFWKDSDLNPYRFLNEELFSERPAIFYKNPLVSKITGAEFFDDYSEFPEHEDIIESFPIEKQKIWKDIVQYVRNFEKLLNDNREYFAMTGELWLIMEKLRLDPIFSKLFTSIKRSRLEYFVRKYYTAAPKVKIWGSTFNKDLSIMLLSLLNNLYNNPSLLLTRDWDFFMLWNIIKIFLDENKEQYPSLSEWDPLFHIIYERWDWKTKYHDFYLKREKEKTTNNR